MRRSIASLSAVMVVSLAFAGCGKKEEEAPVAAAAAAAPEKGAAPAAPTQDVLPGASSVRDALAKKQYETAVGALLALKQAATVSPLTEEYMKLYDEVKFGLMDAAETDPKAAQALAMMRAGSAGR